jgi:hypothetical protein
VQVDAAVFECEVSIATNRNLLTFIGLRVPEESSDGDLASIGTRLVPTKAIPE